MLVKNKINVTFDSFFGLFNHSQLVVAVKEPGELKREFRENKPALIIEVIKPKLHSDSIFYPLRKLKRKEFFNDMFYANVLENEETENYSKLPKITQWLENFARSKESIVGWVFIAELKGEGEVKEHYDGGLYFSVKDRYHLVLQGGGSDMIFNEQTYVYKEGEVWWFNNKIPHCTRNWSKNTRVHLIFDLLPKSKIMQLKNFLLRVYWGLRPGRMFKYYTHNETGKLLLLFFTKLILKK